MDYAVVVAVELKNGTGVLADEPVTVAALRGQDGRERTVRIVGGPTGRGGWARLAGHVVPIVGARVRLDLHEEPAPVRFASSVVAWAPNTPAGTWAGSALPVVFDLALPPGRDLGAGTASELEVAARTWSRPRCTGFRARYGTTRALTSGDDGVNGVFFDDGAWPEELVPGAVAQTILHTDDSGRLRDADIHVNGAAFRFSTDGAAGTQDARGVLVHEIGHALGLGHSSDPRATMNVAGSGLRWRSLEQDDVDGVCALYPGIGDTSCDEAPCPDGFVCVAGACQRPGDRADVCAPCAPELGACEAAGDDARCVDLPSGRACGRACTIDADCGVGFVCRASTEAGDLQCISLAGCTNGANRCSTDSDCTHSGAVCRAGACLGPLPAADAGADATAPQAGTTSVGSSGSDCACRAASPSPGGGARLLWLLAGAAVVRRLRRTERFGDKTDRVVAFRPR